MWGSVMINMILIILEQIMMHIPLMIGAYISLSLLQVPDLSIETAYVTGAVIASQLLSIAQPLPIALLLCIAIVASFAGGALVGAVSSLLTQKGLLPHLLSSIVTFGLFHGINQLISPVYVSLSSLHNPLMIADLIDQHGELIVLLLIGAVIIMISYYLFNTQLGHAFVVYGDNPLFFSNYGISTSSVFITGVMIANGLAGISGYLFAQSNNFLELNMGLGKALFCITSLIIGKMVARTKKPYSIMIPLIGVSIYFLLQQLLLKIGFNLKYFTAMQAVILMCMLIYAYRNKSQHSLHDNLGI